MHDVKVQIRCQRCGQQMDLRDPGPEDPWPPQQFWECPDCGRHFWTTYPPPKKAAPKKPAPKPAATANAGPATPAGDAAATPAAAAPPAKPKAPEASAPAAPAE